jgi:hypothetical protein
MLRDDHARELMAACLMSEEDDGSARAILMGRGNASGCNKDARRWQT